MDWENIRYFLQVARSQQVLAASRRLNADHATVSRRVSALEHKLGVRLFDRLPKGVTLTAAGKRLLHAAVAAETAFLAAQADTGNGENEVAGTIRIAAPDVFGAVVLSKLLASLKRKHPRLNPQIIPLTRRLSLPQREADFAITIGEPREGRIATRKLVDYSLHFYASKRYLKRKGTPASRAELTRHTIVSYVPDLLPSDELDLAPDLAREGRNRLEFVSALAQIQAVKEGAGIGMLHDYAARYDHDLKRVLLNERCTRSYWLVVHLDNKDIFRNRIVADFIATYLTKGRAAFLLGS